MNAKVSGIVRRDVTVVIPAYSFDRWELTCQAISSVLAQTVLPGELLLCIDHNRTMFERFQEYVGQLNASVPMVRVIESKYEGHQAASRTTGVECATGDYLVFLDDDASADPTWLEMMLRGLNQPALLRWVAHLCLFTLRHDPAGFHLNSIGSLDALMPVCPLLQNQYFI